MDAILGAAALGDIGNFFSDTDQEYKDISSLILLKRTMEIVKEHGFTVINADITIIAERPKLAPFINTMRGVIAQTVGTDISNVGIKATTTEGMGFCGAKEGIAALAVVQLSS
jgi:2-C-methyl-D-erythritol 2,4-cyclodiphosphate synthase